MERFKQSTPLNIEDVYKIKEHLSFIQRYMNPEAMKGDNKNSYPNIFMRLLRIAAGSCEYLKVNEGGFVKYIDSNPLLPLVNELKESLIDYTNNHQLIIMMVNTIAYPSIKKEISDNSHTIGGKTCKETLIDLLNDIVDAFGTDEFVDAYLKDLLDDTADALGTDKFVDRMCSDFIKILEELNLHCENWLNIIRYVLPDNQNKPEGTGTQSMNEGSNEGNNEQQGVIPTIFGLEKEKKVYQKAIDKGYMILKDGHYRWNKNISLLALLCGMLYCGDKVKEDKVDSIKTLKKGNVNLPAEALKELFGKNVGANRNSLKNPPRNSYIIEDLFKD